MVTFTEEILDGKLCFLCSAYKKNNGVANIARDVLCRLRSMVHTLKLYDVQTSVKYFKEWEMYKGKLKYWFEVNTYLKFAQIKFNNIFYGALFIFRILII